MYHRPGQLFKDFVVEAKLGGGTSPHGRVQVIYDSSGTMMLKAALAQATPQEKEQWRQLSHPISHVLTQRGRPKAGVGDRLVHGKRVFYIQGVDEPGELGIWTIYYAEERVDTDGHQSQESG